MECASKKEKVYRPRHPEKTPFYSVLFHHFDRFVGEYDLRFEKHYGKWRGVIGYVVAKYLLCQTIRFVGRVCSPESACRLSAPARCIFDSQNVSHLLLIQSKFLYNRKLLTELSRCAWKAIRQYLEVCSPEGTLPAGILSIATAGDFLNWNPHIHALIASGSFHADGSFVPAALFAENVLRELFEAHVYKLLVSKELIGPDLIAKMRTWRHSGFHVYAGPSIVQKRRCRALSKMAPSSIKSLHICNTRQKPFFLFVVTNLVVLCRCSFT